MEVRSIRWRVGTFPRIMPRLERSALCRPTSRFEVIFIFNGRINGTGLLASLAANRFFANPCGIAASLAKLNPAKRAGGIISKRRRGNFRNFFQFVCLFLFYRYCYFKLTRTRLNMYFANNLPPPSLCFDSKDTSGDKWRIVKEQGNANKVVSRSQRTEKCQVWLTCLENRDFKPCTCFAMVKSGDKCAPIHTYIRNVTRTRS